MNKPNPRDYYTNDGMHAAMRTWAASNTRPALTVTVAFDDGSTLTDTFPRAKVGARYKTPDGETYEQGIDGSLICNTFMPGDDMPPQQFKAAYIKWLDEPTAVIRWSRTI